MKKLVTYMMITLLSLTSLFIVSNVSMHAQETTTLIVNYHRFDGEYSGWSLWLWQNRPSPGDGQNIAFNDVNDQTGSRQLVYELEGTHLEGATEAGAIVRRSDWTKDVDQDLFIDLTNPDSNGVVEVYLVSQDPNVYYSLDTIDLSHRLQRIDFKDTRVIEWEASTSSLSAEQVTVYADDEVQSFSDFSQRGFTGQLTLDNPADLSKSYRIEVDFEEEDTDPKTYDIGFRGIYASDEFNDAFYYDGELGALYSSKETTFKLWAPISSDVTLNLYNVGHDAGLISFDGVEGEDDPYDTYEMNYIDRGVWEVTVSGDLHGKYYTYDVTNGNTTHRDVVDPYTRSTGINGLRGMVVDFSRLNPDPWVYGERPSNISRPTEAIIYEAHIRDYTSHETWNGTENYRGKYLGFAETGTTYQGLPTGFDHFVDLGITHVQLLPVHDIGMAIDETRIEDPDYRDRQDTIFNWGYMTLHFNTLEGSYATDPWDGAVRVEEFKQLVQTFHDHDMRVVLDVVYNHTATSGDSNFEKIVPGYYFRFNEDGSFSNGSGTGNETASEHAMFRKFMVDSVTFWAEEYNISGYRFDLMKLHDVETMNQIEEALLAIDENFLIYGEPWDAGGSNLPEEEAAYKGTLDRMPNIGVFNDDTRDGVKGSVFNYTEPGWVQGTSSLNETIKLGIVGATNHPQLNLAALNDGAWAIQPHQTIQYVTAHDNNTLHDKLVLSAPDASFDEIKSMHKQSNAIILTAQGIPFLHGGVEMMRTKPCVVINDEPQGECDANLMFDHNSYRSPDATNQIDWNWKVDHNDVFEYHKGLIALRKATDVFTYDSADKIADRVDFAIINDNRDVVSFFIYDPESAWEYTIVAHNNSNQERRLDLLGMEWNLVVNKDQAGLDTIDTIDDYRLAPNESVVMYRLAYGAEWPAVDDQITDPIDPIEEDESTPFNALTITLIAASGALLITGSIALIFVFKKRP